MGQTAAVTIGSHLRALLGFSRFLQATLSVAQPFCAALVALQGFPTPDRLLLGLSAAWAGFLAVFALNDFLDEGLDRRRFAHLRGYDDFDIDSAMVRHPLAQGQLTRTLGVLWIGGLGLYALVAAYLLQPRAAFLFLLAALLEVAYCKLARITPLKTVPSGAMVGVGALAGWAAMSAAVRPLEMGLLFLWMFAWEIGGRNIVNDFADVEEDARLGVRTVPLVYGPRAAARLVFVCLLCTVLAAAGLGLAAGLHPLSYLLPSGLAGVYLLVWPGIRLLRQPTPQQSLALFNRASFYPPAVLVALIASLYLPF